MRKSIIHKLKNQFLPKIVSCFIIVIVAGSLVSVSYAQVVLDNPLNADSIIGLIEAIVDTVVVLGTIAAAIAIIWAGFLFVTAQGSEEKVSKARRIFIWTVIGVAIIVGAKIIVEVVAEFFSSI